MKKIVCFGDTTTEMGHSVELRGYAAQLADRYMRRADVIPRGFAGYTTREARKILTFAVLAEKPDFVILFFGTTDSVLPGQIPHVPVAEFKRNLEEMASAIASAGAWLVLVTPPPVDEMKIKSRTLAHTAQYAQACLEIGREMNLPVVDLFHTLQEEKNWRKNGLLDGMYLAAPGMNRLYEELAAALDKIKPIESFERMGVAGI